MPRFAASVAMLFNEWALLDRFEHAARAGFTGVEIQTPYDETPADIGDRVQRHHLQTALINVPVAAGAIPGREEEYRAGVSRAFDYARAAGCRQLHCLAGQTDDPRAEATFVANLRWAATRARPLGIRLLLEPLNTQDNPGYFLTGTTQACRLIDRVGEDNVFLQYDFYHMQIMEGRLADTVRAHIDRISHFQIGGVPGRHEPDAAQEINYPYLFRLIDDLGFDGWVGCEYRPAGETTAGLAWARPHGITPVPAG